MCTDAREPQRRGTLTLAAPVLVLACFPGCAHPSSSPSTAWVAAGSRAPSSTPALQPIRRLVAAPPQPDVREALGSMPPEACTGAALDLIAMEERCRCVLSYRPSGGAVRAGTTCGEALTLRDLGPWVELAVVPGDLKVQAGKELWIELRFTNRTNVPMPMVYRLQYSTMLRGAPYLLRDAKGEITSTGGTCGFGSSATDMQSVVVMEPGGTATLPLRVKAAREIFVHHDDANQWGCKSAGVVPLEPGRYAVEVFLTVPGILPQRPLLNFEVVPATQGAPDPPRPL